MRITRYTGLHSLISIVMIVVTVRVSITSKTVCYIRIVAFYQLLLLLILILLGLKVYKKATPQNPVPLVQKFSFMR